MPTIRIDNEVYAWLQGMARPFEDNPNTVLRRVAGLDRMNDVGTGEHARTISRQTSSSLRTELQKKKMPKAMERVTGRALNERWKVGAIHALYHNEGTFYENLNRFPGALFDPNGYVFFATEKEYEHNSYLHIGEKLNVPMGISTIPGYVRVK